MGNYMAEGDILIDMEATILESTKKARRMAKEPGTSQTETDMKESSRITVITDRGHFTKK